MASDPSGGGAAVFRLAPMAPSIRALTAFLLLLPPALVAVALLAGGSAVLVPTAAFVVAVHLVVWLWLRPRRLAVASAGLELVYPLRRRRVAARDLAGAERTTFERLRAERGLLVRVGAGGLGGAFGMLWSSRGAHLDVAISRFDGLVLVHRRDARPLLVTPERPDAFADCVRRAAG